MRGIRLPVRPLIVRANFNSPIHLPSRLSSNYSMGAKKTSASDSGEPLPLSANDFRIYNRMSEQMEAFVSLPFFLGLTYTRVSLESTEPRSLTLESW